MVQPRIYVASLSDYNAGRLHGAWIDAAQPSEEIWRAVHDLLARSPEPSAEEWAIHDYEGFAPLELGEWEDLDQVAAIARGIAARGVAFACWAHLLGPARWAAELDRFDDAFLGHYNNYAHWAQVYLEAMGIDQDEVVPGPLAPFVSVDLERLGHDLASEHLVVTTSDGLFVFEA